MQLIDLDDIRTDGGTQSRAVIDEATVAEYAAAIADGVTLPDAVVFYDGKDYWLADGFHRYHAAIAGDYLELACDVRQGTQRDAVLFSVGANAAHGLRRSNDDKRRAVRTLLADEEWRTWNDREIARRCGVTHPYVATLRAELSGNGFQMDERLVQRGGTTYTMKTKEIGRAAATTPDPEPNWSQDERPRMPDRPMSAIERAAGPEAAAIAQAAVERNRTPRVTSESNEWYTPARYIEAAREVMAAIELDPASCPHAQQTVRAMRYFTIEDNGLARSWRARSVWLNCPYGTDEDGSSNQGRWTAKLIASYEAGEVEEAIVCVNALTYAPWFQQLWPYVICFTDHRIKFDQPADAEEKKTPLNGTAFVYLGPDPEDFAQAFCEFGTIVSCLRPSARSASWSSEAVA